MKTITLTDNQFEQLKEYVIDSCENIMDRSLEWADSDFGDELIDMEYLTLICKINL